MAELYDQKKIYAKLPTAQPAEGVDGELEAILAELPPEEREAARQQITAAPTGEDIYMAMQEKNANGEVFNMNLDQYRLYKAHIKNKETDIIETMGQAAGGVFDEIMKAGGSIADDPTGALAKFTPSLIEAFAQGTRSLYGMAAQSQDPTSVFFRVKNALSANGDDEAAEFQQFMDAQAFNVHSMRLATGQDTLIMDKDVINPEMTQVMSYIADPTLFVPFGGIAAKGARLVGMGEGLAKASARASQIQNKVMGGAIKWGVGAPIEFLGTATRNTIDFGLEKAGTAFETVTGMPAAEARTTAQMYGWYSASAALEGRNVALPIAGNIAGALVGSTTARGVGEALSMVGEQMLKQQKHGRGVLSYAGQALRDADKAGVPLSKHARALLNVIDKADPLFVYSADLAKGAGEGMAIGAGLGYLSAGEEGAASGAGAGLALGTVGAGLGSVASDIGNGRLYDRIAVQRKMVIEGLRQVDPAKASAFEALVAAVETTGNRDYIAQTDGIIAGIDLAAPNAKFNVRDKATHIEWLRSQNIDPDTGRLAEPSAILPEFGGDRKSRARVLSFLGMANERFKTKDELLGFIKTLPQDHSFRKEFFRLSDQQKQVVFDTLGKNQDAEYRKKFGNKSAGEFYKDLNYGEANVARINAMFDSGNKTRANEMIRQMLKDETVNGQLTERGKLLKEKLATEGYFDKDGNMRPSRLKDVELTAEAYADSAGFVIRRDSTGQVEININLDAFGRDTVPHELFHAVMMESAFKPDFLDRLTQNLLGKFDANGKMIERPSVDTGQVKKFFTRYIDALHGKNPEERDNQMKRLDAAIKEYESRGTTNKISEAGNDSLETMVEEFGAYYFGKFINDKPVDFLFRGGELGAMREMMGNAKQGWLDFWRSKIKGQNPTLDFDNIEGTKISTGFGKDGVRARVTALDLFMRDFVRATAMANKQGGFDVSRLSPEAQQTFIKNQGIRVYGNADASGRIGRKTQRQILSEQIKTGKEIYKILSGLDPKYRQGLVLDGEGNLSGRLSPEAMEAMVQSGHIDRAWVDKIQNAYNILDGKGSNVINFGYLGRTAQIGDYAWPRLVGNAVPFKNRAAVLLDVDFKVGKDGKMYALFHTLDKAVIDGRADVLWSDSAIRQLWNNDRAAMDADFFRYLSNASKASSDNTRVESAILLEDGTGKGAMRRNVLHQMLGMVKPEGETYLNKPIAEIPYGIRHSVTTFNVDGISNMRVASGGRWDVVPQNAFRDLARNFQPSEMSREQTPNGSIISHPLGYKFTERNGKVQAFDDNGNRIGIYDDIYKASEAAKKHNENNTARIVESINNTTDAVGKQGAKFQVLERDQRGMAVRDGDVFEVPQMKAFTAGVKNIIRQTREEYVLDKAELDLVEGSDAFYTKVWQKNRAAIAQHYDNISRYAEALKNFEKVKQQGELDAADLRLAVEKGLPLEEHKRRSEEIYNAFKTALQEKNAASPSLESLGLDKESYAQIKTLIPMFEAYAETGWEQKLIRGEKPVLDKKGITLLNDLAKRNIEAYKKGDTNGLPEVIADVYSSEYNQQFQTGVPFVTIATHGTKSMDLMIGRELSKDKLGSTYPIYSSQNGAFLAGQQTTSRAYSKQASANAKPMLGILMSNSAPLSNAIISFNKEARKGTSFILDALFNQKHQPSYEEWLSYIKKNNPQADFIADETSARQAYNIGKNRRRFINGNVTSTPEIGIQFRKLFGYEVGSDKFKATLETQLRPYGLSYDDFVQGNYSPFFSSNFDYIIDSMAERLVLDATLNPQTTEITPLTRLNPSILGNDVYYLTAGGATVAATIASAYFNLNTNIENIRGGYKEKLNIPKEAVDPSSSFYENVKNSVDSVLSRSALEKKNVSMELRAAIRMDNPLVVEGRKEYEEYHLKDIMKPAIAAGHDGVVFRNMRDGGIFDNIYVVFKDHIDNKIITLDTTFDEQGVPRGNDANGNKVRYGKELRLRYQPTERDAGGRVYDQTSKQWKFGFVGRIAEENPELTKDVSLQHIDKGNGMNKLVFTDNSSGQSKNIGHISWDKFGGISTNIDPEFRGRGLSYLFYSEAAERMRAQGIKQSVSTIVNKEAIPVKIREAIFGDTRRFISRREEGKPIGQAEAKAIIAAMQEQGGEYAGVNVSNKIDPNARYQPAEEGGRTYTQKQMDGEFIGRFASENTKVTKGLKPKFSIFSSGDQGNIELMKGQDSVGYINFSFSKATGEALIEYTRVADKQQGKGYGNLLYSELVERLRSMGMNQVQGMIIDEAGRPQKIRERIIDKENARIGGEKTQIDYVEKDPDSDATHTGVTSYLYQKARYQPREEVVQRAKEAGYKPTVYYHGTPKQFTEFKSDVDRTMGGREGATAGYFFFTPNKNEAKGIHGSASEGSTNVMQVFLKYDNPFNTDFGKTPKFNEQQRTIIKDFYRANANYAGSRDFLMSVIDGYLDRRDLAGTFKYLTREKRAELLKSLGYDSLIDKGNHIVVFDPEQIKSADDFTYDDQGREIPLEERFNKNKKDIRYQPREGINAPVNEANKRSIINSIKLNAKSVAALEEGKKKPEERTRNYITIDNINPDLLRGEAVVMHSPDNAGIEPVKIGRFTVQQKGGMRYPIEEFTQGWASNQEGLAKDINELGDDNAKRGKGWWSPLALIKGIPEKNRGTHSGFEIFIRNIQNLVDNGVMSERSAKNVIKYGFSDADTALPLDAMADKLISLSTSNEGKYSITQRREAIDEIVPKQLWRELGKSEGIKKLQPYIQGFNAEGITTAKDFSTQFLRKIYEAAEDPLTRHAKVGEVYAYVIFRGKTIEPRSDKHPSYKYSIAPEQEGQPVQLDILSTPMPARQAFTKKITAGVDIPLAGASDDSFKASTGQQNIAKARGRFQPAEGFRDWKAEKTTAGSLIKNSAGYVISRIGSKYRVYNPYKAVIGVYDNEEQAKRRVKREEPKR